MAMNEMTLQGVQVLLALIGIMAFPIPFLLERQYRIRKLNGEVSYWKDELRRTLAALDATQRRAVSTYRNGQRPCDEPPVGVLPTLRHLHQEYPDDPYVVPLGWELVDEEPAVVAVSLHGDSPIKAGHMLLTGETDSGKDTLAFLMASVLCARTRPYQLQICWIDGKQADGALWRGKAHNWREPTLGVKGVAEAMAALQAERQQREHLIVQEGVTRWEELPLDVRPPLLWVYVSELELLATGTSNLEQWLKTELTAARASGIRYCIAAQTVSGKSTTWRGQVGCYIAGCQSARSANEPNIGLSAEELRERGASPPSELPGPGYFTVRVKKDVATVRAPLVPLEDRKAVLARLPDRPAPDAPALAKSVTIDSVANGNGLRTNGTGNGIAGHDVPMPTPAADSKVPRVWTDEQREQVSALIRSGERTDSQIVAEVFRVRGGRSYRPLLEQVAALRQELRVAVEV